MKAFILTIDALFCLALMLIISTSVFVYSQHQTSDARLVQLNQLGRDYLRMWAANESNLRTASVETAYLAQLKIKTGFDFKTVLDPANPPRLAVRSVVYAYPPVCGLTGAYPSELQDLELNKDDACLNGLAQSQLSNWTKVRKEIWVVVP